MKQSKFIIIFMLFLCCLFALISATTSGSVKTNSVIHTVADDQGTWKKKWTWKQRWVKAWKPKTVYVPQWKRVWTPASITEYVPSNSIPWKYTKPVAHHY